jgi:glutamate N-acetyltransferase/amino-acid N-acetyltransferase
MIAPNMATMLAFITTDAAIDQPLLEVMLKKAVSLSFNCITVDGHTSTNDMVLVMASGAADNTPIKQNSPGFSALAQALEDLCRDLAFQIVKDGEGATRTMEVTVRGGATLDDARKAAFAIANSPLFKCALHGGDPNWGRIISAAGYSGAAMNPAKSRVVVGGVVIFDMGQPVRGVADKAGEQMRKDHVTIEVNMGAGQASFVAWGCDLSNEYVRINAEYHT